MKILIIGTQGFIGQHEVDSFFKYVFVCNIVTDYK